MVQLGQLLGHGQRGHICLVDLHLGSQLHDQPAAGDDPADETGQELAAVLGVDRAGDSDPDGTVRQPGALNGKERDSLGIHLRSAHPS